MLRNILNLLERPRNCWAKSRLELELGGAQQNRSVTAESPFRNTTSTQAFSTTSLTSLRPRVA
ncbi:hypothetical protein DPMN_174092 [Dreissena polymorpha]|uniref:Uncharacterized protein n=1 Tax=Dreissena polymorpha TaxID=45954 RepID=A0A9D4IHJ9_DREPO|nr:hypothetical protein DPMN_174092 [Dreissena polymorpha]